MNTDYSDEIIKVFYSPQHVYTGQNNNLTGYAGDTTIGEYVYLYFQIEKDPSHYAESKILDVNFSAIGGVLLIAAADKFCSIVKGLSFQQALDYCDPEKGLQHILSAPQEKIYSVNFVIQAFYKAFETLTNF